MSTTASLAAPPRQSVTSSDVALPRPGAPGTVGTQPPAPGSLPAGHGPVIMFRVPFASAMSDTDIALLARALDLDTHMHPKQPGSVVSPGLARLDFDSGLFLKRGPSDTQWLLEGRTWGDPPTQAVREWHLRAAVAAHRLDSAVTLPARETSPRGEPNTIEAQARAAAGWPSARG